jgi:hypothetical protein
MILFIIVYLDYYVRMAKVYNKTSLYDTIEKNINFLYIHYIIIQRLYFILNNFIEVIYNIFYYSKLFFLDVMYHSNVEYN